MKLGQVERMNYVYLPEYNFVAFFKDITKTKDKIKKYLKHFNNKDTKVLTGFNQEEEFKERFN